MHESVKALQYARSKHNGQYRKGGVPYIVHPLSMACYAAALGIKDDATLAVILLHDVAEDCGVDVQMMPFSDAVRNGVRYVTITKLSTDESKLETKRRYFSELLNSKEALVCKAIDRYNNLADMPFSLGSEAVGKNIAETEVLLMPVLREAKELWPDMSDLLYVLRSNLRIVTDILKLYNKDDYEKYLAMYKSKEKEGEER